MREVIAGIVAFTLSAAIPSLGSAQQLSESQIEEYVVQGFNKPLGPPYTTWNVFFGPLAKAGEYTYMYLEPGTMIQYPRPEDGVILKCRPKDDTQYCVLIAIRKKK